MPATVLTLLVFEMVSEGAIDMAESDLTTHSQRLNLFDLSQPYFDLHGQQLLVGQSIHTAPLRHAIRCVAVFAELGATASIGHTMCRLRFGQLCES